jgi:hypothetical protein
MFFKRSCILFVLLPLLLAGCAVTQFGRQNIMPCWIENEPARCDKYREQAGLYLFIKSGSIVDQKESDIPTDSQKKALMSLLRSEFIEILRAEVKSVLYKRKACASADDKCDIALYNYIESASHGRVFPGEIELIEFYWNRTHNGKWELSVLGRVHKDNYHRRLENMRKGIETELMDFIDTEPEPREADLDKEENCAPVDFKEFNDPSNPLATLLSETEKMLVQNHDGTYKDPRVLEINSEIYKTNREPTQDRIEKTKEETQRKLNEIIRCYEKKVDDKIVDYFEEEVRLLEKCNKANSDLAEFRSLITEWDNLVKQISQRRNEIKELEEIYKQRLHLLPHTYMLFLYAYDRRSDKSEEIIENYADEIIKNRLANKAEHFVKKQTKIKDGFADVVINDSFSIEIRKSTSDGIIFRPETNKRAIIQKYRLVKADGDKTGSENRIKGLPDDLKAKVFIILGTGEKNVENIYSRLEKIAGKAKIGISDRKEKIISLITQVIEDNHEMIAHYGMLKKEFNEYVTEKAKKIKGYRDRIRHINRRLGRFFEGEEYILPLEVESEEQRKEIKETVLRRVEDRLNYKIANVHKESDRHKDNRKVILFSVIDKTEELNLKSLQSHVKEKYHELLKDRGPSIRSGITAIKNYSDLQRKESEYRIDLKPTGYRLPVLRIRSIKGSRSKHYSLAIAIEAVCLQTIEVFEYDPETRELIDIEHENMRWEVIKGNKMPRKRADKRAEFEYSDYPDYHDFCQRYATFLKEKEGTLSYSKWPDIRCLKPFEYDSSARLIIDNVKKEEWRVMDMMSFFSLQSRTRRTGWKVASYEKIKDFFDDLKEENSKGNIHEYIVNLIEDKSFWTNSSVGRERKDVIRFDLRDERPRPMQDKSLYGLVVKKF